MASELSDRKPGLGTAFLALLIFLLAGVIVVAALYLYRKSNTYDADRSAKRYDTLKQLRTENAKKTTEYAVLDKAKGTYQLPIKEAVALTIKDLASVTPHAAYPVATPVPVESAPAADATAPPAAPAPVPDVNTAPAASPAPTPVSVTTPPVSAATP